MAEVLIEAEPTRRDFLYLTTGAFGAVGVAALAWPFLSQMNPDASTLALSTAELDIGQILEGQSVTVKWRGKPVFVRRRTAKEIEEARSVPVEELPDRYARNDNLSPDALAVDVNRAAKDREAFLVMVGICTHLGCVPLGQQGDYGGWFCPCHGSQYDTAGRIRKGPAPENMQIPKYAFTSDTKLVIG